MQDSAILPTAPAPALAATAPAMVLERAWAVAGLHCAACAEQLRAELLALPGVEQAQVGYAAAVAVVRAPAAQQALLPARAKAAGYRLAPLDAESSALLRQMEARALLWRLFVAGFCMMQVMMMAAPTYFAEGASMPPDLRHLLHWGSWVLSWPVLLFSSQPFLIGAWRSLKRRRLGMDVPVALGVLVSFGVSTLVLFDPNGVWGSELYFDSFTMFVAFLLSARWFELKARHAAAAELAALTGQQDVQVQRETADGRVEAMPLAAVRAGELLRVGLGERIPVDGCLLEGNAQVDEALLTGESQPLRKLAGDALVGGSLNLGQPLRMRAAAGAQEGRAAQLAQRLQAALTERPAQAELAERWASHFLAAVLLLALGAGVVWSWVAPQQAVAVVCAVLIVTCPCAFALAQPAARVASHRWLARQGLLLQRLPALEVLARVDRLWLDKTGTLTRPEASVRSLCPEGDRADRRGAAVALASWSRHPVAQAVARSGNGLPGLRWREVQELPGQGLRGQDAEGQWWRLRAQSERAGAEFGREGEPPLLAFDTEEAPLPGCARWLAELRALGLQPGLLSGDRPERVARLAAQLGINEAHGACSPEQKLERVRAEQQQGACVLMVGDGVNDAPVLAQADASLAVGGATGLAAQAADVLLLRADLSALPGLIRQARRTQQVMRQNLIWAAVYNGLAVPLALLGYLPPWAAGLGMALSSLLVVGNSLRLAR